MIHPISAIPKFVCHLIEGSILTGGMLAIISDQDWQRMTGPHGVAFIAVLAVIVLWANGLRKEKAEISRRQAEEIRAEARRVADEAALEKRHTETMTMQRENADKLMQLTVESIKAQGHTSQAIISIDSTIKRLTEEVASRPCQKANQPKV